MTPRDYRAAALALLDAEATRRQIGLLSLAHPGMTLADAYAGFALARNKSATKVMVLPGSTAAVEAA